MKAALDALSRGLVVAAATESFFGLLADATNPDALSRLASLKPRSTGSALVLPSREAWTEFVDHVPPLARRLADAFWPGPLTIALPPRSSVDVRVTVDGTVGVRLPGESPAARLATAFGRGLTATSANPHGRPAAVMSSEVEAYFVDAVARGDLVILAGRAPAGVPSTIVVVRGDVLTIAREGAVPAKVVHEAARAG